jgi:hypothetical protein
MIADIEKMTQFGSRLRNAMNTKKDNPRVYIPPPLFYVIKYVVVGVLSNNQRESKNVL